MSRCHRCGNYPCSCHSSCHSCGSHSCHGGCTTSCSCITQTKGNCVFYQGSNLSCLGVTKGDNYDEILVNLNDLVCDLVPPSGIFTTLTTCNSGDISLTLTTPSGIPNYRVCLNPNIRTQLDTNTSNINVLDKCIENGVLNIVSDDIVVSVETTAECGRTLRLDLVSPSGLPTYDGIIYSDLTKSGTSGAVGATETLKYWDNDYIASNSLTTGDEIRFTVAGQIDPTALGTDTVTIELYNTFTASVIDSTSYSSWLGFPGKQSSFVFNGVISLASLTNGRYTLMLDTNNADNSQFSICNNSSMKSYDVSTYNFSYLRIAVKFLTTSGATSGNNYVHKLMVEVRKKI